MRAIVSAYAVRPYSGSETGLGWNWIKYLARSLDYMLVITESEFQDEILDWIRIDNIKNVEFEFISVGSIGRLLCWNQGNYLFYIFNRDWKVKGNR